MSLSLLPPGPIPIGLCLRGEPHSDFLRGVGPMGGGKQVGSKGQFPHPMYQRFLFFYSQTPILLPFGNH